MFLLLGGCAGEQPAPTPVLNTADAKTLIEKSLFKRCLSAP